MEKKTSPANKLALKRILAQEGNGRCADCKTATHPRWASWNIGILICIRCSGIHRSLGTHISKVRSIDLDTWNDQQLEKLIALGNTKANAYWEAKLKPGYIPDESKIVNFIKTKYELKRWVPEDDDTPLAEVQPGLPPRVRASERSQSAQPSLTSSQGSVDLLDLDGAFNVRAKPVTGGPATGSAAKSQPAHTTHHHTSNYSDSHTSSNKHHSHHHNPFSSHSHSSGSSQGHHHHLHLPHLHSQSHRSSPQPSQVQPPQRPASQPQRSDIKKSILALYSDKKTEKPLPRSPAVSPSWHTSSSPSLTGSLADLSFASAPARKDTSAPTSLAGSANFDDDYDDESFANVWK